MKKVLLVGEHPQGMSGNSHMMRATIDQIDQTKYEIAIFSESIIAVLDPYLIKFPIIVPDDRGDLYGNRKLMEVLNASRFDLMLFVGVDLWHYSSIWNDLIRLKQQKLIRWAAIFPYDLTYVRKDWLFWIKSLDIPCVYSKYGEELLKPHVPNIRYYRPPMFCGDQYKPLTEDERQQVRKRHFGDIVGDKFLFGFIGNNQYRKDPQRVIKCFFDLKKQYPDICLYLHTNITQGVYNLAQYIEDCGGQQGDILVKNQNLYYSEPQMVEVYNAIDCLVNASWQEGLSWTILQAQLCKIPIIATDTTAQSELLEYNWKVPCTELTYLAVLTASGTSFVETKACSEKDLLNAMLGVYLCKGDSPDHLENSYQNARDWINNPSNANDLLDDLQKEITFVDPGTIDKVLFVQHSSAGDVFMTTRCFKGLKERYNGLPLVYMTQPQYQDIVTGNPYIDEIIDWNLAIVHQYKYVINPHGDRIMPGHWGRNSNSILSDFYWKILNVKPDDFYIDRKSFKLESFFDGKELDDWLKGKPILVVHTTGGAAFFRTYKYMKDICQAMDDKYLTVQLGAGSDYPAWAKIDLRGKLSFRETAWVMSKARLAVTVDSFISHLAGALGVSQVCLFGSGNAAVVKPNQVKGGLICRSISYVKWCKGLGPCSGVLADCPVPCTSRHDPKEIIKDLEYLESSEGKDLDEMRISE